MPKKKVKVFVAMSGGVDSSVAAALLKRDGFDVVGVYMKCWTANDPLYQGCTSQDDERSARLAASHLGIPFYTWNFIKEYRERVVEYLIEGYKKGITPNPDMMCNKEIKFGLFFEKATKLGADFVATGHYARMQEGRLLQAIDKNKDQSYFLSFIKAEVLSKVLFPIGNYTKPQVRALAKKFGLPNAERKESQGICFIGKLDFTDFLKQHIPLEPGNIVDTKGKVLGQHQGLALYTIGQRKEIRLSGGPWYVVEKDYTGNTLVVSKDEKELGKKEAQITSMNWLSAVLPVESQKVEVKIRYRTPSVSANLELASPNIPNSPNCKLIFEQPQRAVTPGQFAVLYKGEQLLGGGVIK
ncbi:MAG: tRNA 2-thiouridine(34) synthase MnmA [Candidatus Wildermuthbacteria bacterium RIFCSPLOWO2_01_FULL_47_18]|uniref:tRNA-specific 2-thiouridylase MnmA n=2 Tax=Candidatus Wildermuthiibacteriota TaxID=1817923 RepID=A0A1G2RFX8_9BACT|nr:MAG: tRNA 2-thiouridine(34) synthase MnmA [Candidatus Wildermuthbacteria bacterium RIFCSPLOWO2_01_FULL_47_18]